RLTRPPLAGFVAADQSDAEIAARRQCLAIGAQSHHGAVDVAIARVENIAVLIDQAVALHVSNQWQPEQRLILAVVPAPRTGRIFGILRAKKQLGDHALVEPAALDEQEPADRIAGLLVQLLP